MAISIVIRGTPSSITSQSSWGFSPTSNYTKGNLAILAIGYDNSGTNGADPFSSISDSNGNTWTLITNKLNDPGAANEGCVVRIYYLQITSNTQLTTSTTVTINFSPNVSRKLCQFSEIASDLYYLNNPLLSSSSLSTSFTNSASLSVGIGEVHLVHYITHYPAGTMNSLGTNGWDTTILTINHITGSTVGDTIYTIFVQSDWGIGLKNGKTTASWTANGTSIVTNTITDVYSKESTTLKPIDKTIIASTQSGLLTFSSINLIKKSSLLASSSVLQLTKIDSVLLKIKTFTVDQFALNINKINANLKRNYSIISSLKPISLVGSNTILLKYNILIAGKGAIVSSFTGSNYSIGKGIIANKLQLQSYFNEVGLNKNCYLSAASKTLNDNFNDAGLVKGMSISSVARGVSGNTTSQTAWTFSPASNFTTGSFAIVAISYDNAGSQGSDPFTSISDSTGKTWTLAAAGLNDPGAASAGIAARVYYCDNALSPLTTSSVITVNFSTGVTAKAYTITEVVSTLYTIQYISGGAFTASTTTTPTVSRSSNKGELLLGILSAEGAYTVTDDTDVDSGLWSVSQTQSVGSGLTGALISSQVKVLDAGSAVNITYNPTVSTSADLLIGLFAFKETTTPKPGNKSLTVDTKLLYLSENDALLQKNTLFSAQHNLLSLSSVSSNLIAYRRVVSSLKSISVTATILEGKRNIRILAETEYVPLAIRDSLFYINKYLKADQDQITLSPQSANLLQDYVLSSQTANYSTLAYIGSGKRDLILETNERVLYLSTSESGLYLNKYILAENGLFALDPQPINFLKDYLYKLESGSLVLTANIEDAKITRYLLSESIALNLTDNVSTYRYDRVITANQDEVTASFNETSALRTYVVNAELSSITTSVQNAELLKNYLVVAQSSAYYQNQYESNLLKDFVIVSDTNGVLLVYSVINGQHYYILLAQNKDISLYAADAGKIMSLVFSLDSTILNTSFSDTGLYINYLVASNTYNATIITNEAQTLANRNISTQLGSLYTTVTPVDFKRTLQLLSQCLYVNTSVSESYLYSSRFINPELGTFTIQIQQATVLKSYSLSAGIQYSTLTTKDSGLTYLRVTQTTTVVVNTSYSDTALLVNYSRPSTLAQFTIIQYPAQLSKDFRFSADALYTTLTTRQADLLKQSTVIGDIGLYNTDGKQTDLLKYSILGADTVTVEQSFKEAALTQVHQQETNYGTVNTYFPDTSLIKHYSLQAGAVNFDLTDYPTRLSKDFRYFADSVSTRIDGQQAGLYKDYLTTAESRSAAIDFLEASLIKSYLLSATPQYSNLNTSDADTLLASRLLALEGYNWMEFSPSYLYKTSQIAAQYWSVSWLAQQAALSRTVIVRLYGDTDYIGLTVNSAGLQKRITFQAQYRNFVTNLYQAHLLRNSIAHLDSRSINFRFNDIALSKRKQLKKEIIVKHKYWQ